MSRYLLKILFFFLLASSAQGQALVGLEIEPDSITIGEETSFVITVQYARDYPISYIDLTPWDSIKLYTDPADTSALEYYADVEWQAIVPEDFKLNLDPDNIITTNDGYIYKDTLTCRFWDTGVFIPEQLRIVNSDSSINQNARFLQAAYIKVYPPMDVTNPDTTKLILPIEDIVLEEDTLEDYIHIIYGLALLLGIMLFVYLYRKFTKEKEEAELAQQDEVVVPPHIIALEALDELETKQLWLSGKEKQHQTELTYILRSYLENQFDIPALESTTDEIRRALQKIDWNLVRINDVNEILQIADLVKFAKAQPDEDIHQAFINRTRSLVTETSSESQTLVNQKSDDDE